MSWFLASVRSADEADVALAGGADIIDAKEPAMGALGAVAPATLRGIAVRVAGRLPVSATIGDLELRPDAVRAAVETTTGDGADIVKIGLFAGDLDGTLAARPPARCRLRWRRGPASPRRPRSRSCDRAGRSAARSPRR